MTHNPGDSVTDSLIEVWQSEHSEDADFSIDSEAQLRDYLTRVFSVSSGAVLICAERQRQIEVEGYTIEHDRKLGFSQLVDAAFAYATGSIENYPWHPKSFKLKPDLHRNLAIAGALIAAALDAFLTPTDTASPDDHASVDGNDI
ncbi:Uncharacterised protein [Mycobacteroides abscessus subsp. abscessus]|uniref:hypothetical protein n=1 Tax=Mycobacteroides abscessus TaxID=36809 RepID=UPI0009258ED4|nr:hypothetical protein [Mycobacteroides abscessus]SIC52127.1 Uncharacterised protein [Mycobacteroides abscessus subsp. abscessus]SID07338.1 Uncharacterised protein [Mycobacteroides abscessus subsp. abscessus]SID34287.1 Uncharacterised protein [Mycobacteroides abscessus subsp. abscessus]SID41315.1 Uncharacterised protein [Mycobacteroides abscessus subsp. abscessus]SKT65772.1 Uncharacterised protein [Mycobacteroides abscessus subsp. abscessus]